MSIGIYKITNIKNNHCYIGQSVNIERRVKTHFWAAYKENLDSYNNHFYQAIRKYGKNNFKVEILETIPKINVKKLNELEIKYIKMYDSFKNGYNMTSGGDNNEQNLDSGEKNGHAKLTKQEVIDIRESYNRKELKRDVYKRYQDKIGESGFAKIWNWETWKNVVPEYHSKENIEWHTHQGKGLSSEQAALNGGMTTKEQIFSIRELAQEGISPEDIISLLDLKIGVSAVRKIISLKTFSSSTYNVI